MSKSKRAARYRKLYAGLDLALLPLETATQGDRDTGKQPRVSGGYKAAKKGAADIEELFAPFPNCNIGIATGKVSGVWAMDIDPAHGGSKTLRRLERKLGALPDTWEVLTSNGGRHLYFTIPPHLTMTRDSAAKLFGPGIDILWETSHAVAPPSVHHTGHVYEWKDKRRLNSPPGDLPAAWLDHLTAQLSTRPRRTENSQKVLHVIPTGHRNDALFKMACGWRAGGSDETELLRRLKQANRERCEPPLERSELGKIAASVAKYMSGSKPPDLATIVAESLIGDRFANGRHLMHWAKRFYYFIGTHWAEVSEDWIKKEALLQIKSWTKRAHLKTATLMNEVVQNLRATQEVDSDPFAAEPLPIVNCQNGELWLEAGRMKLRRHRPSSFQQHVLPIEYDADAKCPRYDTALAQIFSEAREPDEMVRHWHELVGYTIQPSRPHALIVVLLGRGGNGKTKLVETLFRLMGKQSACFMNIERLSDRFGLAGLRGKLMFVDDDVKMRLRLPEEVLKKISEVKEVTAEAKYKDPVTFTSRAIPYLLCNGIPHLQDPSDAILRRLQVFPFKKQFKGSDRDPTLFEGIWIEELPGILNRALEGWGRLQERGDFAQPNDVKRETKKWVNQAHPVSTFVEEATERDVAGKVLLSRLYDLFRDWAKEAGIQRPVQRTQFSQELEHLGFEVKKSNGQKTVYGLTLR